MLCIICTKTKNFEALCVKITQNIWQIKIDLQLILTTTSSYSENETLKSHLKKLKGLQTLDLGCLCDTGSFYIDYNETIPEGINPINDIKDNRMYIEQVYESREVKEIEFSDSDVSLFTFFFNL